MFKNETKRAFVLVLLLGGFIVLRVQVMEVL